MNEKDILTIKIILIIHGGLLISLFLMRLFDAYNNYHRDVSMGASIRIEKPSINFYSTDDNDDDDIEDMICEPSTFKDDVLNLKFQVLQKEHKPLPKDKSDVVVPAKKTNITLPKTQTIKKKLSTQHLI